MTALELAPIVNERIPSAPPSTPPAISPLGQGRPFDAWPSSWYFACVRSDLDGEDIRRITLAEERLILFLDEEGVPCATSAHCAHMGADLGYGKCRAGKVRCPLHAWEFSGDGRCRRAYGDVRAQHAKLKTYPVHVAAGCVFIFIESRDLASVYPGRISSGCDFDNHATIDVKDPPPAQKRAADVPTFPLPFFVTEGAPTLVQGKPLKLSIDGPWFWVGANGFDVGHFEAVHGRRCLNAPVVHALSEDERQVEYDFEIEGRSAIDKLIRIFLGANAKLTLSTWRGTVLTTCAHFGRGVTSYAQHFITPTSPTSCSIQVVLYQPKIAWLGPLGNLVAKVVLAVKRRAAANFFREETKTLRNMGKAPVHFAREDEELKKFFLWLQKASSFEVADGR